jgi:hypothetical protein
MMPANPVPISTPRTEIVSHRSHFGVFSEKVYSLKDVRGKPPCCVRVSFEEEAVRGL